MLYTTGTVTVTSGSHIVTGSGTSWASLALPLVFGTLTGGSYECSRIVDNTTLWLSEAYQGTTTASSAYVLSDSFTAVYNFPFTTTTDARQADTLSSFLISAEKKLVELNGGSVVSGQRLPQYTTGYAKMVEGSSSVTGYGTLWSSLAIASTTEYSGLGYFPSNLWPTNMFTGSFWPGDLDATTSATSVYIKRRGETTVYTISNISRDTALTTVSAYDPDGLSISAYSATTTYSTGSLVTFNSSIWQQIYGSSIKNIPPVAAYSASTTYRYGNLVLYNNSRYYYIYSTASSNHVPTNATYWRAATEADFLNAKYWTIFKGYEYQIVYSTTENYHLPIITTGALDKWSWFRKAITLLDSYL